MAVDHRERRALGQRLVEGGLDLGAVVQVLQAGVDRGQTGFAVQPRRHQLVTVGLVDVGEEGAHDVAEDDRIGDLHHRGLEVHGEQDVLLLGAGHLSGEELPQCGGAHHGAVDDLALEDLEVVLQYGLAAVGCDVRDGEGVGGRHDDRLLVVAEVAVIHRGDVRPGIGGPGTHAVRELADEILDGLGRAAVGVTLTQDRVDGGALHGVVAGSDIGVLVGLDLVRVIR